MDKEILRKFYVSDKLSVAQIAQSLYCSENKVNYWLSQYSIKKRSISEAAYLKHNPGGDPFKIKRITSMDDAFLHGLGLGLYWGEGNKKNKNSIRLGNTNPVIIITFIDFLINSFGINANKLRFGLQIFSDMSAYKITGFWLNKLRKFGINKSQFFKVTVTPARSIGTYREKSRWGVMTVYFCNQKLKNIIDSHLPL